MTPPAPVATCISGNQGRRTVRFELTAEQEALRDTARAFAAEALAPHAAKWDEEGHFPVATLREAAALGFAGLYVREDVGGSGLGRIVRFGGRLGHGTGRGTVMLHRLRHVRQNVERGGGLYARQIRLRLLTARAGQSPSSLPPILRTSPAVASIAPMSDIIGATCVL